MVSAPLFSWGQFDFKLRTLLPETEQGLDSVVNYEINMGGYSYAFVRDLLVEELEDLKRCKNLVHLRIILPGNMTEIPSQLWQLSNLTCLELDMFSVEHISDSIGRLKNITRLRLDSEGLQDLPDSLISLSRLDVLSIVSSCRMADSSLSMIKKLSLKALEIHADMWIRDCESFNSLEWIATIKSLEVLSLCNVKVPTGLNKLPNLKVLQIGGVNKLPEDFVEFPSLKIVDFSSCEWLGAIPVNLTTFSAESTVHLVVNDSKKRFLNPSVKVWKKNNSKPKVHWKYGYSSVNRRTLYLMFDYLDEEDQADFDYVTVPSWERN